MSMSTWADRYFYLVAESSGTSGPWETRPYQKAPLDCMGIEDIEVVTYQKPGRVGFTKMLGAAMGYNVHHKHRNQVMWQPTDGDAKEFVKDELDPMLRDVPVVGGLLKSPPDKKSKHNTVDEKSFVGSTLHVKGGKSPANYRRMTKDVAYYDELAAFDDNVGKEGDATALGDKRLTQSPFPKSIRGSTPKIRGICQIEKSMSHADMRFHRFFPCPSCSHMQELAWARMRWTDGDPATTVHVCEACQHGATYSDYLDSMDIGGQWRSVRFDDDSAGYVQTGYVIDESLDECILRDADGNEAEWPRHVGFWLWGAFSYELTWPAMVAEFIEANEAKKIGAIEKLITFVNMRLAETWEEQGEKADDMALFKRKEPYSAQVPDGVQLLTAWADVQDDRIEYEVDGWGCGEESWAIDYVVLRGDPSKNELWDKLLEGFRQQYRRADGSLMDIKLAGIDSGGHYTDEVYKFSRQNGPTWIIPTKGSSEAGRPIATMPRKRNAKGVYLTIVGTDTAKEIIYRRYTVETPGPGYCHWPQSDKFDKAYFDQATAEKKIRRYRQGRPYYVWDAEKRRNEALDCRVGNLVMVRLAQQHLGFRFAEPVPEVDSDEPLPPAPPPVSAGKKPDTYVKGGIVRRRSTYL